MSNSLPSNSVILLLFTTWFIGSLVILALGQAVAGIFRLKPKNIQTALENLSFSAGWKPYVQSTLIKNPHIEVLMKEKGHYPAYIPANNFVLAIIHEIGASQFTHNALQTAINSSQLPAGFRQILLDIAAKSQYDICFFEKELAVFYDQAMDQAAGWYKVRFNLVLFIISFLLAVALNIDIIRITAGAPTKTLGYNGLRDFREQWFGDGLTFLYKLLGIVMAAFFLQMSAGLVDAIKHQKASPKLK